MGFLKNCIKAACSGFEDGLNMGKDKNDHQELERHFPDITLSGSSVFFETADPLIMDQIVAYGKILRNHGTAKYIKDGNKVRIDFSTRSEAEEIYNLWTPR